jgi:hypothetical protein
VKCWGNLSGLGLNPASLSNMLFDSITAGSDFMCGIRDTGAAYCWGNNAPAAKPGTYYALAAGQDHVCGIKADRSLDCWTRANDGTDSPPAGTYQWIASGTSFSCAIVQGGNFNGRGWCWGTGNIPENNFPSTSNTQTYAQLFGSPLGGWAVLSDGVVTSWGVERFSPPSGTRFNTVAPGIARDRCGIATAGTATCWGYPDSQVTSPPSGTFTAIAIGGSHACGVKSDGQMACWGNNTGGQAPATVPGTFQGYW